MKKKSKSDWMNTKMKNKDRKHNDEMIFKKIDEILLKTFDDMIRKTKPKTKKKSGGKKMNATGSGNPIVLPTGGYSVSGSYVQMPSFASVITTPITTPIFLQSQPTQDQNQPMHKNQAKFSDLVIGSKVKIGKWSEYYGQAGQGLKDEWGKVVNINPDENNSFYVQFQSGLVNNYRAEDLELFKAENKIDLWKSLVLPEEILLAIQESLSQTNKENEELIFEKWGFGSILEKGKGIAMLFHGYPGTGKTLTAEAIAQHLGRELKIIGSAEVMSAEPGGTERAIKQFFAYAKTNNCVLLFDECDSLIYNRQRVGMIIAAEINCLLGEIERFDGVCLFTTNNTPVLDKAFERRLSFKVEFPKPTKELRMKIWQRMFPKKEAIGEDIDFSLLSKYVITGGQIKNIVLNAARRACFLKRTHVSMDDIIVAIKREESGQNAFNKVERGMINDIIANSELGMSEGVVKTIKKIKEKDIENGN